MNQHEQYRIEINAKYIYIYIYKRENFQQQNEERFARGEVEDNNHETSKMHIHVCICNIIEAKCTYRHVLSMSAPYVREKPISRSHTRTVHVMMFGLGYITMVCNKQTHIVQSNVARTFPTNIRLTRRASPPPLSLSLCNYFVCVYILYFIFLYFLYFIFYIFCIFASCTLYFVFANN